MGSAGTTEHARSAAETHPERAGPWRALAARLASGAPLRVVFVNDCGFVGGAGIALRRQVQSFLLGGHAVVVLCCRENPVPDPGRPAGAPWPGEWLGLAAHPALDHAEPGLVIDRIRAAVAALAPDLIVTGNFHTAGWPLALLPALRRDGFPVVAYLHDCHWLTGRCAHPGTCAKFETGCDATCPTPGEYPALAPALIAAAWAGRRAVFTGPDPIPLAANSRWTATMARRAFGAAADIAVLHLGLDHARYMPRYRAAARARLGLSTEGVLAVAGAQHALQAWKGGVLLAEVIGRLRAGGLLGVFAFGRGSTEIPGAAGLGLIEDDERMPLVFAAADLMLNCSQEEAFGQTLLEAAACGVPIVATRAGGAPDIARAGENALLVERGDAEGLVAACERLAVSPETRRTLGLGGRAIVEREFTLARQYARWRDYLLARAQPIALRGPSASAPPSRAASSDP
jgi:glycosyltransferase involved in cell wall biosynthesis